MYELRAGYNLHVIRVRGNTRYPTDPVDGDWGERRVVINTHVIDAIEKLTKEFIQHETRPNHKR